MSRDTINISWDTMILLTIYARIIIMINFLMILQCFINYYFIKVKNIEKIYLNVNDHII